MFFQIGLEKNKVKTPLACAPSLTRLCCETMIVALLVFVASAQAGVYGLDVSQPVSATVAKCFVDSDFKYVILRGYFCGSSTPDTNAVTSYRSLRAAGMQHIGFYLFPCVGRTACRSPEDQVLLEEDSFCVFNSVLNR
jgi:hypothetical protein